MRGRRSKRIRKRERQRARHQRKVQSIVQAIPKGYAAPIPALPRLSDLIAGLQP
jgi:hypothetical protein